MTKNMTSNDIVLNSNREYLYEQNWKIAWAWVIWRTYRSLPFTAISLVKHIIEKV